MMFTIHSLPLTRQTARSTLRKLCLCLALLAPLTCGLLMSGCAGGKMNSSSLVNSSFSRVRKNRPPVSQSALQKPTDTTTVATGQPQPPLKKILLPESKAPMPISGNPAFNKNGDPVTPPVGNKAGNTPANNPLGTFLPGTTLNNPLPGKTLTATIGNVAVALAKNIADAAKNPFLSKLPQARVATGSGGEGGTGAVPYIAPPDPFKSLALVGIVHKPGNPMAILSGVDGSDLVYVKQGEVLTVGGQALRIATISQNSVTLYEGRNKKSQRALSLPDIIGYSGKSQATEKHSASSDAQATTPSVEGILGTPNARSAAGVLQELEPLGN
ncbi:MAG: hypothetical protein K2X01_07980 [Cyanobacteria bacterium]|nr:hypothetical protein [Cyanobacteriota bacterium]